MDSEGTLKLTEDVLGQKTDTLVNDLTYRFHQTLDWGIETPGGTKGAWSNVLSGKTLMGTVELGECASFAQQDVWAFGVLPFPMWNTDQGKYYTNIDFDFGFFSVPMDASDPNISAAVLECMNSEAYRSSTAVYFETVMKGRYAQDELDPPMYDIIKENVIVDVTRIFCGNFTWANTVTATFRRALQNNVTGWMSGVGGIKDYNEEILSGIGASLIDPLGDN